MLPWAVLALALLSAGRADAQAVRRLALVIGNNAYSSAPLRNAVPDAVAMTAELRGLGFEVTSLTDAALPAMERAIDAFAGRLRPGDVALFYYSGHGVQIDNENYLVPTDFRGGDEVDLKFRSYSADRVHDKLQNASVKILILDACRDNPFRTARSAQRGLVGMQARGSLIAFATAPGSTASDVGVAGQNGLFTEQLLAVLREPGLSATEVFRRVRQRVFDASGQRQFPWLSDGLLGEFVFRPAAASNAPPPAVVGPPTGRDADLARREEIAFWEGIPTTGDPQRITQLLTAYEQRYGPSGRFSVIARARLSELTGVLSRPPTAAGLMAGAAAPVLGARRLDGGFRPDPLALTGTFGGSLDVRALNVGADCIGYASAAPTFALEWGSSSRLEFHAVAAADVALVVRGPTGEWACNDDTNGSDPAVVFASASPGRYDIWVTTFERAAAAGTLLVSETGRPDPAAASALAVGSSSAVLGSRRLAPGFRPDPLTLNGTFMGSIRVQDLGLGTDCVGFTTAAPTFVLDWTGASSRLGFHVTARGDTALLVRAPSGSWNCDDDTNGMNPAITYTSASPGRYEVWVATYEPGAASGAISVTERDTR